MSVHDVVRGIGVSPGVAYARATLVRTNFPDVPDRTVRPDQIEDEVARLRDAVRQVTEQLQELGERVLQRAGVEESRIFDAQIMMAQDEEFLSSVEVLIRNNHLSAETAYEFKALELRALWSSSGSAQLRDRLADLHAIQIRMLRTLLGRDIEEMWAVPDDEQVIVVAHELSPGLTVQLDREHVVGLVSEQGTRTSHAAILAHSLGIPAVMGASGALERIPEGTMVLLDGQAGTVTVEPSNLELDEAKVRMSRRHRLEFQLESTMGQPAVTPDGRRIALMSNVDLPDEIEPAVRVGAEGVGLLRTEFLLTGRAALPTEQEQVDYFRRVSLAFPEHSVVIRSYDVGGDKFPSAFRMPQEANPFLGWRSIRVCLDQPEMFRAQLRAVLRAAADRKIQLLLPLVTTVDEVLQTREMLQEEADGLRKAGVRAAEALPVGVMIETPAATLIADQLAEVSDFFSIGSNDLTQYTLAIDRGNARLADRFTPYHPAILRQLEMVLAAGEARGIPVSVCGEMASEPLSAVLLLGMGFATLSVAPPAIPLVKWVVRSVPFTAAREAAEEVRQARSPDQVGAAIRRAIASHVDLHLFDLSAALPGSPRSVSLPTDSPRH
ncbi:MAG: phosphoenolpyruvate--protein phosphotransferase [Gemmatimonadales bacterium]